MADTLAPGTRRGASAAVVAPVHAAADWDAAVVAVLLHQKGRRS